MSDIMQRPHFIQVNRSKYPFPTQRDRQLQKARREIADGNKICTSCQKPIYKHLEIKDGKLFYTCRLDWDVKPLNSFMPTCSCCGKPLTHSITISRKMCSKCFLNRWK